MLHSSPSPGLDTALYQGEMSEEETGEGGGEGRRRGEEGRRGRGRGGKEERRGEGEEGKEEEGQGKEG